ncbi:LON peptidase substrate-binding domain-containing protein [Rhodococcus sp. NPDC003318]|uniref:LON peptidase substrate-binding domain-containing protein n=1 Tax=Rhodococcus sp. NPDC003318 TaxID=3364503 RepID=UPI0036CD8344
MGWDEGVDAAGNLPLLAPGTELPMFPLGAVLLPGEELPLQIFEPRYLAMVDHCVAAPDRMRFGVVLITRGHEVGGGDERTSVGTVARITSCSPAAGGRLLLGCVGGHRIRVDDWLDDDPYPRARVRSWPDEPSAVGAAMVAELTDRIAELTDLAGAASRARGFTAPRFPDWESLDGDPGRRGFALARALPLGAIDRLRVLSAPGPRQRVAALIDALDDVVAALRFRLADPGGGEA